MAAPHVSASHSRRFGRRSAEPIGPQHSEPAAVIRLLGQHFRRGPPSEASARTGLKHRIVSRRVLQGTGTAAFQRRVGCGSPAQRIDLPATSAHRDACAATFGD